MPRSTRSSVRSRAIASSQNGVASTRRQTRSGQTPSSSATPKTSIIRCRIPKPPTFAFLARHQDIINADPNRQLRLFALPKELIEQIATHLPLTSVICLTLTCKEAAETVGTQSWATLKTEGRWSAHRYDFIELLARDWGDRLDYCQRCDILHPPLQPPRNHRGTKLTKRCFGQDAMIDYLPQDASQGYNPVLIHITNAIEETKDFASKGDVGPLLDTLSGSFEIMKKDLSWCLDSTGRRIDGNLVLKHVHTFRSQTSKRISATDLLTLPIRLCPHQSTATNIPESSRYINGRSAEQNGRLLTHVIASAFPESDQSRVDVSTLGPLTPSEQAQVFASKAGEKIYWQCRSCPTKYRVQRCRNTFVITSWHSFGRDMYHAMKYWKWLVRRTGTTLGPDKRNDEWWSSSRTVPDFMCELE